MSRDAMTHLQPSHVVVVDVGGPHAKHLDWFPGAPVVKPTTPAFEQEVRHMLGQVDSLLLLETPYDARLYDWAREAGVFTVVVAMPEYHIPERWRADLVVNPTSYLHDRLPEGSIVLPWPVDTSAITYRPRTQIDTWLHVVGQPCAHDRNGTNLVLRAFEQMPEQQLIIRSQVPLRNLRRSRHHNIQFVSKETATVDELYQDADAFILPRRYAGQSLVINEAQAAGLPLVCLDRVPEAAWTAPKALIPSHGRKGRGWTRSRADVYPRNRTLPGGLGQLEIADAAIEDVVRTVHRVAGSLGRTQRLSDLSRHRALSMSWDAIGDRWRSIVSSQRVLSA